MQLNTELIDIARDLSPLRFIFLQLMLKIGNARGIFGRHFDRYFWNGGRLAAVLAIQRHSSRSRIDHKGSSAIRAGENDIAARRLHGSCGAACWLHCARN